MLAGKTLTEFTNLFSPNDFKKSNDIILTLFHEQYLKMVERSSAECNSIKHDYHKTPNMYPNLSANISNGQQFRLNKINEIKDYFIAEIRERELISKNLSKYIASFEYLDKSLTVLLVATGSISIASFVTAIGVPLGTMNASCSLAFPIKTGFVKKILKTIRNKKKKTIKLLC